MMPTARPSAVAMSASEMPPATTAKPPVPAVAARQHRDHLRGEREGRRHRAAQAPQPLEDDPEHHDRAGEQRVGRDRSLLDQLDEVEVDVLHPVSRLLPYAYMPRAMRATSFS